MPIKADTNPRFFWRFALIGVVLIGFTGWCFKDALHSYPRDQEACLTEFHQLHESGKLGDWPRVAERNGWEKILLPQLVQYQKLNETDELNKWPDIAEKNGWEKTPPEISLGEDEIHHRYEYLIVSNYLMASVTTPLGLWALIIFFRSRGRWMEADQTGIRSSWGKHLTFGQILNLDKKKWREKGIAKIKYQDAKRPRRFILDDCKFNREATEEILRLVETNIQEDQIINGSPEPPLKTEQELVDSEESGSS